VKEFKKILRVISLVMLITMACFGIGLAGGIPVPMNTRKENLIEWRIEQKERDENKEEELVFKKLE
jgi:hypothetical protein